MNEDKKMAIVLAVSMLIWFPLLFVLSWFYDNAATFENHILFIYSAVFLVFVTAGALLTTYYALFYFALSSTREIIERGDIK